MWLPPVIYSTNSDYLHIPETRGSRHAKYTHRYYHLEGYYLSISYRYWRRWMCVFALVFPFSMSTLGRHWCHRAVLEFPLVDGNATSRDSHFCWDWSAQLQTYTALSGEEIQHLEQSWVPPNTIESHAVPQEVRRFAFERKWVMWPCYNVQYCTHHSVVVLLFRGETKKGGCEPDSGHTVWPLRSAITNKEIINSIRMASVVRFDSNSVSLSSQHWPFPKHMDHRADRIIYPKHQIVCMKHVTRGQRCSKMWPAKWNQWNQTVVGRLSKVHTFDCCRCIKSN